MEILKWNVDGRKRFNDLFNDAEVVEINELTREIYINGKLKAVMSDKFFEEAKKRNILESLN